MSPEVNSPVMQGSSLLFKSILRQVIYIFYLSMRDTTHTTCFGNPRPFRNGKSHHMPHFILNTSRAEGLSICIAFDITRWDKQQATPAMGQFIGCLGSVGAAWDWMHPHYYYYYLYHREGNWDYALCLYHLHSHEHVSNSHTWDRLTKIGFVIQFFGLIAVYIFESIPFHSKSSH